MHRAFVTMIKSILARVNWLIQLVVLQLADFYIFQLSQKKQWRQKNYDEQKQNKTNFSVWSVQKNNNV